MHAVPGSKRANPHATYGTSMGALYPMLSLTCEQHIVYAHVAAAACSLPFIAVVARLGHKATCRSSNVSAMPDAFPRRLLETMNILMKHSEGKTAVHMALTSCRDRRQECDAVFRIDRGQE